MAVIAAAVLIVAAFLTGYLPERGRRVTAERESATLREQLATAEARVRMGQLLGQVLAVRDVVAQQNYGQGQDLASVFFDGVRREAAETPLAEFRSVLSDALSRRDAVTAALAKADPGSLDMLRTIETEMRGALGYPRPQAPPVQ
jgi:hypothetical protein